MPLGLSSLGRCEARVLQNLDAVIASLSAITGTLTTPPAAHPRAFSFYRGNRFLQRHTDAVFGPPTAGRQVRIMVTLPGPAADDYPFVRDLVARGADVLRINGAHDGPEMWTAMAVNVRRASKETARGCRLLIDLEGPRARTGRIADRWKTSACASAIRSGSSAGGPIALPTHRKSNARCRRRSVSFVPAMRSASTRAGSDSSARSLGALGAAARHPRRVEGPAPQRQGPQLPRAAPARSAHREGPQRPRHDRSRSPTSSATRSCSAPPTSPISSRSSHAGRQPDARARGEDRDGARRPQPARDHRPGGRGAAASR